MPKNASLTLQISGMSCASCVGRIEKALVHGDGVTQVQVNLATESALVEYVPEATNPDEIAQLATSAGYPATFSPEKREEALRRKSDAYLALKRQVALAAILALPVFLLEMGGHLFPAIHHAINQTIGMQNSRVLQFALTTLVLIGPGLSFYTKGLPALAKGVPDMNSLVALGTLAAYSFSTIATFAPNLLPDGTANVYFEAAAVIVVLILLGRLLEARAKGHTGDAIQKLIGLQPKRARVERNGEVQEIDIDQIRVGDIIQVRPGEKIAADGMVLDGTSFVDESMITGEPIPVEKSAQASVVSGTINGAGAFRFTTTKTGEDTVLAQIIAMVARAQGAKLPIQALVDQITAWFVPAVMGFAALTVLVWAIFGPDPALGFALVAGVSVLIIACPCAMGLATPTSIMVGTGRAAEMGVLFRQGSALQGLQDVSVIAVDKTGTLTQGKPVLTDLETTEAFKSDDVLQLVASVEATSEHPIAQAIVTRATDLSLPLLPVTNFESITGLGVRAKVNGHDLLVGADRLMARENVAIGDLKKASQELGEQGKTPLYAAIDGRIAGVIAVSDPLKETSVKAVKKLQARGLKVVMITGDNRATAMTVAKQVGITEVLAEVLPEAKSAEIDRLKAEGETVGFVGDGINDAPALASADVGIAIGTGTEIAIEAAEVVLISGDLSGVVNAFDISAATLSNIRQNLFWAFGYNVLLIPIAAGVLYPINGMLLSPILAAGAMSLSSVFVLSNALRLRWVKPQA